MRACEAICRLVSLLKRVKGTGASREWCELFISGQLHLEKNGGKSGCGGGIARRFSVHVRDEGLCTSGRSVLAESGRGIYVYCLCGNVIVWRCQGGFCGEVDRYCIMKTGNAGKLQGDPIQRQLEWVWLFREVRFIHMNCVDSDCYEAWNRGDGLNHVLEEKWRKNAA